MSNLSAHPSFLSYASRPVRRIHPVPVALALYAGEIVGMVGTSIVEIALSGDDPQANREAYGWLAIAVLWTARWWLCCIVVTWVLFAVAKRLGRTRIRGAAPLAFGAGIAINIVAEMVLSVPAVNDAYTSLAHPEWILMGVDCVLVPLALVPLLTRRGG